MPSCLPPQPSSAVPPLTAKTIVSRYAGSWAGVRPTWIGNTGKIIVRIAGTGLESDGTVEIIDTHDGSCTPIGSAAAAVPAPDGRRFAMIGDVDGKSQLWVQDASGKRTFTTKFPNGTGYAAYYHAIVWSSDSSHVLFGFQSAKPKPAAVAGTSTVTDFAKHGSEPPPGEIDDIDATTGVSHTIATGPYLPESLSLDAHRLVFAAVHYGSEYSDGKFWGEIRALDLATGKESTLVRGHGVQTLAPGVLSGGRGVVFNDSPLDVYYPENLNVALDTPAGTIRPLTTNASFPHEVMGALVPDPRGCGAFFTGKEDAYQHVYHVDCSGTLRRVDRENANVNGFSVSPDGKTIAVITEDILEHVHLATLPASGDGPSRLIADFRPDVERLALGAGTIESWKAPDGVVSHGFVIVPHDYHAGTKYPLIVDVHGGPTGGVSLSGSILCDNPLEWQLWAARGYVVLVPDYRSGLISGWDAYAKTLQRQDSNERDFDDIMSGVDMMIAKYRADPAHMALYGHSNGGYETNWLVTHTHRFRVAVSYEGWADWYLGWSSGARVGGNPATEFILNGKPWDVPQNYLKAASAMAVKGVTTPTLFISGSDGIALYNNQFMYGAWLNQAVPTDLLIYQGEGHVIESKPNLTDLLDRTMAWIETYV